MPVLYEMRFYCVKRILLGFWFPQRWFDEHHGSLMSVTYMYNVYYYHHLLFVWIQTYFHQTQSHELGIQRCVMASRYSSINQLWHSRSCENRMQVLPKALLFLIRCQKNFEQCRTHMLHTCGTYLQKGTDWLEPCNLCIHRNRSKPTALPYDCLRPSKLYSKLTFQN